MDLSPLFRPSDGKHQRRTAFTLLELLVVIAIIVILIALLFPALSGMRERVNVATCLHNMKQLATGSLTFAADHDGQLPCNNSASGNGSNGPSWVSGFTAMADPYNPVATDGIAVIEKGCLWQYVKDRRVYLCPSYPQPKAPPYFVRSYSCSDYVSGWGGSPTTLDGWQTMHTIQECHNPSQVIWFTEENPRGYPPNDGRPGINDGYFRSSNLLYRDKPGTYHSCTTPGTGKCNAIFLDGHGQTFQTFPAGPKPTDEFYKQLQKYPQLK